MKGYAVIFSFLGKFPDPLDVAGRVLQEQLDDDLPVLKLDGEQIFVILDLFSHGCFPSLLSFPTVTFFMTSGRLTEPLFTLDPFLILST